MRSERAIRLRAAVEALLEARGLLGAGPDLGASRSAYLKVGAALVATRAALRRVERAGPADPERQLEIVPDPAEDLRDLSDAVRPGPAPRPPCGFP